MNFYSVLPGEDRIPKIFPPSQPASTAGLSHTALAAAAAASSSISSTSASHNHSNMPSGEESLSVWGNVSQQQQLTQSKLLCTIHMSCVGCWKWSDNLHLTKYHKIGNKNFLISFLFFFLTFLLVKFASKKSSMCQKLSSNRFENFFCVVNGRWFLIIHIFFGPFQYLTNCGSDVKYG